MILHTRTYAAPHGLIRSRIVAIVTRTCRGEIHVATMHRVLTGEDMIESSQLVVVGIASLWVTTVHILRELQHIVCIAALRTVNIIDKIRAGFLTGEMFTTAIAAKGQRALTRHDIPEEIGSIVIDLVAREF